MSKHTTYPTPQEIPYGYCQCGCGQKAPVAERTNSKKGWIKGEPKRFISGHFARLRPVLPPEERFWRFVNKRSPNGCWLWTGGTTSYGYGGFQAQGHTLAHRFSYELHCGPIPNGMFVCHRCDNPACVNPAHLFLGKPADNTHDMMRKGRMITPLRQGSRNGRAKLTEKDVRKIRALRARGVKEAEVARQFGVSISTVSSIKGGRAWSHVT